MASQIYEFDSYKKDFFGDLSKIKTHPMQGDIYQISEPSLPNISGLVVVTNACDIVNNKTENLIHYVPIFNANLYFKKSPKDPYGFMKPRIRQQIPDIFYIPPNDMVGDALGGMVEIRQLQIQKFDDFIQVYRKPVLTIKNPYIDLLSLKISVLFNRIPVNAPDDVIEWLKKSKPPP